MYAFACDADARHRTVQILMTQFMLIYGEASLSNASIDSFVEANKEMSEKKYFRNLSVKC